ALKLSCKLFVESAIYRILFHHGETEVEVQDVEAYVSGPTFSDFCAGGARTMADRRLTQNGEDAHTDLLATLAASRELGAEMDKTLAESYLAKHGQLAHAPSPRQEAHSPAPMSQLVGMIGPAAGIGAYIVLLVVSGGDLWWMF